MPTATRFRAFITALFNRPEVLAADVGLDTEVRPIPAFSDANLRRLAASAVDQILSVAPVSSDPFFADAVNDYDEETKLGAFYIRSRLKHCCAHSPFQMNNSCQRTRCSRRLATCQAFGAQGCRFAGGLLSIAQALPSAHN